MLGFFILEGGGEGVEYSRRGLVFLSAFCFGSLAGGYAYALGALVLLILVVGVAAPMVFAILILMLGIMST